MSSNTGSKLDSILEEMRRDFLEKNRQTQTAQPIPPFNKSSPGLVSPNTTANWGGIVAKPNKALIEEDLYGEYVTPKFDARHLAHNHTSPPICIYGELHTLTFVKGVYHKQQVILMDPETGKSIYPNIYWDSLAAVWRIKCISKTQGEIPSVETPHVADTEKNTNEKFQAFEHALNPIAKTKHD